MGRYMRKCKGVAGDIAVVKVAELSASAGDDDEITRSPAVAMEAAEDTSSTSPPEKRKRTRTVEDGDSSFGSASCVELRSMRRRVLIATEATTKEGCELPASCGAMSSEETNCSDLRPASCCSGNVSGELGEDRLEAADATRERDGAELGTLTFSDGRSERSKTVESRVVLEESGDLENSTARRPSEADSGLEPTVQKMPSESEIEQFFSTAEKDLHKRFTDKYNFDIVKDVPLEGRYEWIPMKP